MKNHNTTSPPRLVALMKLLAIRLGYQNTIAKSLVMLVGAALLGLVSQSALAAITASGIDITNMSKLSYTVNGAAQNEICSSPTGNSTGNGGTSGTTCTTGANGAAVTTFKVDNKVNLTVIESGGGVTTVLPAATAQVTTFQVTNNGNTAQGYTFVADNAVGSPTVFTVADNIQASAFAVYVDSNGNGIYESGTDTATAINTLAQDASVYVFVLATIPALAANGDQAVVTLTATTTTAGTTTAVVETGANDPLAVDIVFADAANALSDPFAANTEGDAIGIAQDAYRVSSATIVVTKTATVLCDPFNGVGIPNSIPGAMVRWTITVTNNGSASATLGAITDGVLDSNTTFDVGDLATGLLSAPSNAATCVAGTGSSGFKIVSSNGARILGGAAGVMTNAAGDTDGAGIAAGVVTIDFANALPAGGAYTAGELKPAESATVTFNVNIK